MKAEILQMLRESGDFVSGQELCERFAVSRTAVWKSIQQLQKEGYQIEAVTRKGYRLEGVPDTVAAAEVESLLRTQWIARPVKYFEQITSTNQYAKQMGEEDAPEGMLVVADCQTKGRGRSGRSWATPPGKNIAMSLLLRPPLAPERISMVTLVMGMAVACACRKLYALPVQIKWPNDVVIGGKKLCGILTEMSTEITAVSYIVIGTGINVNMTQFPEELISTATSLVLELGREVNRAELIACVMEEFEGFYQTFLADGDLRSLRGSYNDLLANRDRGVRVLEPGHEYDGTAEGIDDRGQLLVRLEDGSVNAVYAGEVSVRGIYGYV